jgi:hypothetical protein
MEPRWKHAWMKADPSPECVFLGGTNRYDLWVDEDGDLRVVRGESIDEWDYFQSTKTGGFKRASYEMRITDEEWEEVLRYLSLFAPDWQKLAPETDEGHPNDPEI